MREVLHVESAGGDVGGHEQLHIVLAELLHGEVALLLAQVAVERFGVVAVLDEFVGNLLRLQFCAAEDDGVDVGIIVHDTFQCEILVPGTHHVVDVVDVLGALVARADDDLLIFVKVALGDALNLPAHGGGEEQGVALLGQMFEDGIDAVGKAHVEHFVGLVEDHVFHVVEFGYTALNEVDEASRCGDNDLYAMAQGVDLCHDGCTAINGYDAHIVEILGKVVEVVGNLQTEFTGGREDQRLRVAAVAVDLLQNGNAEGRRLACAGLC